MVQKFFVWRAELRIAFFIDLRCYVVQWLFQFGMVGALYFYVWIMWWQSIYCLWRCNNMAAVAL